MTTHREKLVKRAIRAGIPDAKTLTTTKLEAALAHPDNRTSDLARDTTALQNIPRPFVEDLDVIDAGSSAHRVLALQAMLCHLGFTTPIDGAYGLKTERAVQRFQAANDLTSDGRVNRTLFLAIADSMVFPELVSSEPEPEPEPDAEVAGS
jgi:peptidoglycan hydrolase-like protein with peptidoglycan-binding domain